MNKDTCNRLRRIRSQVVEDELANNPRYEGSALVYSMTHPLVHRAFTVDELGRFTDEELAGYYRGGEVAPTIRPLSGQSDRLPDDRHECIDCGQPLANVRDDMCDACGSARIQARKDETLAREARLCGRCGNPIGKILGRPCHSELMCDACWTTNHGRKGR